ncbi:MAG: hypothetical protein PHE58_04190 [Candidatus Omnitrophica bacterium]|nr:hypothetical protein [Candidatus Omnitrophota bacterium]
MNILLSQFPVKELNLVRRLLSCAVALCFGVQATLVLCGGEPCYAAAKQLQDNEMDAVYAEGISFKVDIAFGKMDNLLNTAASSAVKSLPANGVVYSKDNNVARVVAPTQPVTASVPQNPQQVLQAVQAPDPAAVMNSVAAQLNAQMPSSISSPVITSGSIQPVSVSSLSPQVGSSSGAGQIAPQTEVQTVAGVNSLSALNNIPVQVVPSPAIAAQTSVPNSSPGIVPLPEIPSGSIQPVIAGVPLNTEVPVVSAPVSSGAIVQPASTGNVSTGSYDPVSSVVIPVSTNGSSAAETMQINTNTASTGPDASGDTNIATLLAQGGAGMLNPSTSGVNVVVVDKTAQQYLSSLVNVNAAGSIVPVMINIVININSTVSNISNANNLDLSSYSAFTLH